MLKKHQMNNEFRKIINDFSFFSGNAYQHCDEFGLWDEKTNYEECTTFLVSSITFFSSKKFHLCDQKLKSTFSHSVKEREVYANLFRESNSWYNL